MLVFSQSRGDESSDGETNGGKKTDVNPEFRCFHYDFYLPFGRFCSELASHEDAVIRLVKRFFPTNREGMRDEP